MRNRLEMVFPEGDFRGHSLDCGAAATFVLVAGLGIQAGQYGSFVLIEGLASCGVGTDEAG